MQSIGSFADWVTEGAAFGIKAFFAVLVFLLCCCTVLWVLAAIASVFGGRKDDMDRD
jgi:hypothetical protein